MNSKNVHKDVACHHIYCKIHNCLLNVHVKTMRWWNWQYHPNTIINIFGPQIPPCQRCVSFHDQTDLVIISGTLGSPCTDWGVYPLFLCRVLIIHCRYIYLQFLVWRLVEVLHIGFFHEGHTNPSRPILSWQGCCHIYSPGNRYNHLCIVCSGLEFSWPPQ